MAEINRNQIRAAAIINNIGKNKDLDLRATAEAIAAEIRTGEYKLVTKWFNALCEIHHCTVYGLGTEWFADRAGGWGMGDSKFLESLRFKFLANAYGVRVNGCNVGGLTKRQLEVLAEIISRPFYTLQIAMAWPDAIKATEVAAA